MASNTQEAVASEATGTRVILIVEDEETICEFIVRLLEEETPYKALSVPNAMRALELVDVIKPDLFMLDYRLPGINGMELFDRLHVKRGLEAVPALMFSANVPPQKALEERHIPFLLKPFDLDDLLQVVEKLLIQSKR